jgi:hypothetical protein
MKARVGSRWMALGALGLAVASLAAPVAQGQGEPYGELYQHTSVASYGELYQHEFALDGSPVAPALPETDPLVAPTAQAQEPYGELYQHQFPESSTPVAPSDAFDWPDAGIGAGAALAAMLLAAAAALELRRRGLAHS